MAARPAPTEPIPKRIVVIGCAGSGKTTLARALAVRLGARHLERDAFGDDDAPEVRHHPSGADGVAGNPPPSWS
jgi:uridine kinase